MSSNVWIKLIAPNDTNGNPRRMFVCIEPNGAGGKLIGVATEGYTGSSVTAGIVPGYVDYCIGVDVSPKEYNAMKKYAASRGILVEG